MNTILPQQMSLNLDAPYKGERLHEYERTEAIKALIISKSAGYETEGRAAQTVERRGVFKHRTAADLDREHEAKLARIAAGRVRLLRVVERSGSQSSINDVESLDQWNPEGVN